MKGIVLKKVLSLSICAILCLGLIQNNVIATELKNGQPSQLGEIVKIQDGDKTREDIVISEEDKDASLNGKISADELMRKYNVKKDTKIIDLPSTQTPLAVNSTTRSASLSSSFYFLNDSSLYGGDQSLLNSSIAQDTGCGPIAGANIFAYHAKGYGRSSLYPYSWNLTDWKKFQQDLYAINGGIQTLPGFTSMINSYATAKGYKYTNTSHTYVLNNSTNLESLTTFVKGKIDDNGPVSMLLGGNMTPTKYETSFTNHWVTITGYNFNNGNTDVTVSSWGGKYTLSLAKLLEGRIWIDVTYVYKKE